MKIRGKTITNTDQLVIIGVLAAISFLSYIFYTLYRSNDIALSVLFIPIIAGIIYENYRLSVSLQSTLKYLLFAILISAVAFIPLGEVDGLNFKESINLWQMLFTILYVGISLVVHEEKTIPKITEGSTLLLSLSIAYWIIDIGLISMKNIFIYVLLTVVVMYVTFSIYHAFSYKKLTKNTRLFLSIWSSIVMMILAGEYLYIVIVRDYLFDINPEVSTYHILQYFLTGVSLIYLVKNAEMIFTYLPGDNFYGKEHREEIKKINLAHIKRYCDGQVSITDSVIAFSFATLLYLWNYVYNLLPRQTMIWLVIWSFPILLNIKNRLLFKE